MIFISFRPDVKKITKILKKIKKLYHLGLVDMISKINFLPKELVLQKIKELKKKKFITSGLGQYRIPKAFDYINDYTRTKDIFEPIFKYL